MTAIFDKPTVLQRVRFAQKLIRAIPDDGDAMLPDTNAAMAQDAIINLIVAYNLISDEQDFKSVRVAVTSDTSRKQPPVLLDPIALRVPDGPLTIDMRAIRNYDMLAAARFEAIIGLLSMPGFLNPGRKYAALSFDDMKDLDRLDRVRLSYLLLDLIEVYTYGFIA
ncbi:hypothetical protein HOU03_gp364 [Caulobacter phage CcrSC]|uniref:Uncharacterized protein n=1 Tax=Caulobacter phage CcrSC TaxID=2283272 RepID=A0A385EDE7_9CAUD|nr:hypothetical protein HOU03_gp364 [Caulobacter phage CcrSC]AXQ69904.1 hypothetical protein CcrSC_gp322 [Caulobacter phage CcrSC]